MLASFLQTLPAAAMDNESAEETLETREKSGAQKNQYGKGKSGKEGL
jgi:hypothetical protein